MSRAIFIYIEQGLFLRDRCVQRNRSGWNTILPHGIVGCDGSSFSSVGEPVIEGGFTILLVLAIGDGKFLLVEHLNDVIAKIGLNDPGYIITLQVKSYG